MAIRGAKKKEEKPLYVSVKWWFKFPARVLAVIMEMMMPHLAKLWNSALAERVALDEKARERLEKEFNPLAKLAKEDDQWAGHGDLWAPKNKKVTDEEWLQRGKPKERVDRRRKLKNLLAHIYTQVVFTYLGEDVREAEAKERAAQAGHADLWDGTTRILKKEQWLELGKPENLVDERLYWFFRRRDKELMLKHQINSLTSLRDADPRQDAIRRTCQEETLKTLHGAWLSFMMLRAAGDKDARPPGQREEAGFFHAIPNRTSFNKEPKENGNKLRKGGFKFDIRKDGKLEVALGGFMDPLVLPIPDWNEKEKDGNWKYRRRLIEQAVNFRQVTISRRARIGKHQEADLSKPGRFKVSLSFDIPKPAPVPQTEKNTVYVAVGGSALGIVSALGEEVIHLEVPSKFHRGFDQHGRPKGIDEIDALLAKVPKGCKRHGRLVKARQREFAKMAAQKDENTHVTIARERRRLTRKEKRKGKHHTSTLLGHGIHFRLTGPGDTTSVPIRSQPGHIANKEDVSRGGVGGANQRAMGDNMAKLKTWLQNKVRLFGGSVKALPLPVLTKDELRQTNASGLPKAIRKKMYDWRKIFLARRLKEEDLAKEAKK